MTPYKTLLLVSSPRSGSSMLRNKLNDFEHIVALPGDSCIVEFCYRNQKLLLRDSMEFKIHLQKAYSKRMFKMLNEADWRLFLDYKVDSVTDILRGLGVAYANCIGKELNEQSIVVEKSPNNMYYLSYVEKFLKDAQIVYLHRDARDVVASLNAKPWSTHNTVYNAKRWDIEQRLMNGKFDFAICYERLVQDPRGELKRLLGDIEYVWIDEVDRFMERDSDKPQGTPQTDATLQEEYQYKFLSHLSQIDREQEIIEFYCRETMERLGYELFAENYDHRFFRKRFFLWLEFVVNRTIKILKRSEEY